MRDAVRALPVRLRMKMLLSKSIKKVATDKPARDLLTPMQQALQDPRKTDPKEFTICELAVDLERLRIALKETQEAQRETLRLSQQLAFSVLGQELEDVDTQMHQKVQFVLRYN